MRAIFVVSMLLLAGCNPQVRYLPGPVEYRDRIVVEPVNGDLLKEHPIAEGPLSQCLAVASERKLELQKCNSDKKAIRDERNEPSAPRGRVD